MKSKQAIHSFLIRCTWMTLTLWVLVFCGPMRKMIEFHFDKQADFSSQASDKKLKTYYREKKDIPSFTQSTEHNAPDIDLVLFSLTGIISLFFLLRKSNVFRLQYISTAKKQGTPLYLQIRKLQV